MNDTGFASTRICTWNVLEQDSDKNHQVGIAQKHMLALRNMFQILHILCVCWLIRGWYASWSQSMHGIKKLFIVLIMYHEYWVVTDFFAFSAATYMVLCVENRIEVYTIDLHKKWFCKKGTSLIFFLVKYSPSVLHFHEYSHFVFKFSIIIISLTY